MRRCLLPQVLLVSGLAQGRFLCELVSAPCALTPLQSPAPCALTPLQPPAPCGLGVYIPYLLPPPPPPPARSEVNLWPEDVPNRTLVVLAGKDKLIHVDEVGEGGEGGGGQGVGGRGQ